MKLTNESIFSQRNYQEVMFYFCLMLILLLILAMSLYFVFWHDWPIEEHCFSPVSAATSLLNSILKLLLTLLHTSNLLRCIPYTWY